MKGIDGKVAIVTGGASGLGAGVVRAFISAGAKVAIADVHSDRSAALPVSRKVNCRFIRADLRRDTDIRRLVNRTVEAFGGIDFLVNCACTYSDQGIDTNRAGWRNGFDVNVFGHVMLVQKALEHLRRSQCASIVNLTSVAGTVGIPGRWVYPATKAAIQQVTRSQAIDLAAYRVRVNAVMPAWIAKPNGKKLSADEKALYEKRGRRFHMLGRIAMMEEVTDAIIYLCSGHAGFITGSCLHVDGGYSAMGPQGLEKAQLRARRQK